MQLSKKEINEKLIFLQQVFNKQKDFVGCEYKNDMFIIYIARKDTYNEIKNDIKELGLVPVCCRPFKLSKRQSNRTYNSRN